MAYHAPEEPTGAFRALNKIAKYCLRTIFGCALSLVAHKLASLAEFCATWRLANMEDVIIDSSRFIRFEWWIRYSISIRLVSLEEI